MGSKKKSVIDELLGYVNPKPVTEDSDGEFDADVHKWYASSDDELEPLPAKGRKRALDVSEYDERYAGNKLSRVKLGFGDNRETEPETDLGESEGAASSNDDIGSGAESEVESGNDYSGSGSVSEGDEKSVGEGVENDGGDDGQFQHMSRQNLAEEVAKGKAVKQQLDMWDNLLECRIKFQKCLVSANSLPRHDVFKTFMCDHDPELKAATQRTRLSVSNLLSKLLELRTTALDLFTETARANQNGTAEHTDAGNESGEEISSEDDDDRDPAEQEFPREHRTKGHPRRHHKMKIAEYSEVLKEAHESYAEYRNATIQKWNDKTRVAVGNLSNKNFSAFEQSTVKQIEQVLVDRQRLVLRSQVKRASYKMLGRDAGGGEDEERDAEVFDDGDFYQQQVRELIERKCAGVTDPTQLGRQWLQLQKLRSKMKRKVDTRATKGRKLSYAVHPKMVSFMAPVGPGDTWSNMACSELYGSLFGNAAST